MSRALFVCGVVLDAAGVAYPATEDVRNSVVTGNFPCCWTITTFQDARRVAVGLAEVTAAQLTALDADTRIRVIDLPTNWKTLTWGDVALATRTSILNFLTNRGVSTAGLTDLTPLTTIVTTLCNRFRAGRRLAHLETELSMNFGV